MLRTNKLAIPGLVLAGVAVWAQNQPKLTPREAFFLPFMASGSTTPKASPPKATPKAGKQPKGTDVATNTPKPSPTGAPPDSNQLPGGGEIITVSTPIYQGPRPLGLRYSVLKMQEDKSFQEVSPKTEFRGKDRIRIQVQSNEAGYLYIVAKGTSGKWEVLFPDAKVNNGDNTIEPMQPQTIPNGRGVWTLDERKGEERIFLVFSRRPVDDLDKLIYDLNAAARPPKPAEKAEPKPASTPAQTPKPPRKTLLANNINPIDDAIVGRLRSNVLSRDLVFEEVVDDTTPADKSPKAKEKEYAVYVTETSGRPDARLIADIKLVHQ